MKFETTKDNSFLGKWKYQAQFAYYFDWVPGKSGKKIEKWRTSDDRQGIADLEFYLRNNARGEWTRVGNNFYVNDLDDIFRLRLFFDDNLKLIRRADG